MKSSLFCICLLFFKGFYAQELPYKNKNLPIKTRVTDLMTRMTAEEKFRQLFMVAGDLGKDSILFREGLFGFQINTVQQASGANNQMMHYAAGPDAKITLDKINAMQHFFMTQTRLGIPMIAFDEALHGLVRTGATSFPQSIGMAASFDTILMNQVSEAIALECRARGLRLILSPVINLATDVRWGRVEETYGEDPFLSSIFGVSYVRAMESRGIITTPKHFITNHGDGGRDSYPVFFNERYLHETYLKPFKAVIQKAGARSIMTAYNSFDGKPCTANNYLLRDVLRKQWGFDGFVISDAAATGGANVLHFTAKNYEDAGKKSIENGLDVIFQTDFSSYSLFKKPFLDGQVRSSAIDSAVGHVLAMKFELGLFDEPYVSEDLLSSINLEKHRKLAYEMAVKSAVLLKNDSGVLPLSKNLKRIAVIGPDADEARQGGYSGPGNNPISILDGIKNFIGSKAEVFYAQGCHRVEEKWKAVENDVLFHQAGNELKKGLKASYFSSIDMNTKPVLERIDSQINFQWTLFGPDVSLPYDHFAAKWEGILIPKESGTFEIGIEGNDGYRLYLNDELIIDLFDGQSYHTTVKSYKFAQHQQYRLRIEYQEKSGNSWFKLIWNAEIDKTSEQKMLEALKLAKKSDVTILVVGIEEGEFRDRSSLKLPGRQEELIQRIAAIGKPVVVILVAGSAVTMDSWLDKTDAILDVWYPGEMGGIAIADLLFGEKNPSGRLPITFPKNEGQLPLNYNHYPTGRGDDYVDGSGQALFPFGYGLSYSKFEYTNLKLSATSFSKDEQISLTCTIKNTSNFAGEEVVQLFTHDELASIARPVKELKSFQRVFLNPEEEKEVTFIINPQMFSFPNENLEEIVEAGFFRLMIGTSSKDIRLRTIIEYK